MGLFAARDRWGVGGYYVPRQAAGKIRSYTGKGGGRRGKMTVAVGGLKYLTVLYYVPSLLAIR